LSDTEIPQAIAECDDPIAESMAVLPLKACEKRYSRRFALSILVIPGFGVQCFDAESSVVNTVLPSMSLSGNASGDVSPGCTPF
jgi:hypothetical protein